MTAPGYPRLASIWKMGSVSKGSYKLNRFSPKSSERVYCNAI